MKKYEIYKVKALTYIDDVLNGNRICGDLEYLAVKRHIDDIKYATEKGFYFDEKAAKMVLAFFSLLKHFKGEWAGREFELEGWQCFIIWCVFGWKKAGGYRRFNYADIEVARKNGKTMIAAGIALYMMLLDNEPGAEIYSAAVDKEQAKICWEAAVEMGKSSDAINKKLTFYRASIVKEDTASTFKPLSKDSKNKDGFNPHCATCDERHAWKTNEVYEVIDSGMGARRQPLIFSITTAGFDMECPYYKDRITMIDILRGIKIQDNHFVMIFSPDKDDDWKDPKAWQKANPNFGVSVKPDYMQAGLEKAMNKGGTTEVNFKTKNLNMWVDAPDVWVSDDIIKTNNHDYCEEDLIGQVCYAGLDLASHVDINALALYFPSDNVCPVKFRFWVPEGKLLENKDKVDYAIWRDQGWLTVTPGDVIDIDYIIADIINELKKYDVKTLSFDPYKAYHGIIQGLQDAGFSDILDEFAQSIGNMSEPAKQIEKDLISKQFNFLGNPIIRWMFRNVIMYKDANGNIRPDKKKSPNKIDGVVALIDAIGGYMSTIAENKGKKIYQHYSLRTIKM